MMRSLENRATGKTWHAPCMRARSPTHLCAFVLCSVPRVGVWDTCLVTCRSVRSKITALLHAADASTRVSAGPARGRPSPVMEELKRLRAEQIRAERAVRSAAAKMTQLQLEQLRAEAAQRRAQVRAALRAGAGGIS